MSHPDELGPEGGAEIGGEKSDRIERTLELLNIQVQPLVEKIARDLRLPMQDVIALAVVFFSRYLDLRQDKNTLVLVVKGTVTPYDTALEALLDSAQDGQFVQLIEYLRYESAQHDGQA